MKTINLLTALTLSVFAAPASFALEVGDAAPCVVLNHLGTPEGQESEHCIRDAAEGQKKVLEFFSAVCSDCARNLPKVSNLARELGDQAVVRLIGLDRSEALLREHFMKNKDLIPGEVALDTNRDAKKAYGVVSTPTLFLLDQDNKIIFKHEGVLSNSDLMQIKQFVRGN